MNAFLIKVLAVGLTVSQIFTRPAGPNQVRLNFPNANEAETAQSVKEATALLKDGCQYVQTDMGLGGHDLEDLLTQTLMPGLAATTDSAQKPKRKIKVFTGDDDAAASADQASAPATTAPATPSSDDVQIASSVTSASQALSNGPDADNGGQISPAMMLNIYRQLCKGEAPIGEGVDLVPVLKFYNDALQTLPDFKKLVNLHLPESSEVLLDTGDVFTEISQPRQRRHSVALETLPAYVYRAFPSAEDQNFFTHHGLDLHGIIRAFQSGKTQAGHYQGGSTITQQVTKNFLVGDKPNFERKIIEMVAASLVETQLSKMEILSLYANGVYLGRSSWGIAMAAQSYFGKSPRDLTIAEAAFLAGQVQGPGFNNPDTHMDRAMKRRAYVLERMHKDGVINDQEYATANNSPAPTLVNFKTPSAKSSFYFLDAINRDVRETVGLTSLTDHAYVISSTLSPELQAHVEKALDNGLADWEANATLQSNKPLWEGPEGNIADDLASRLYGSWQEMLPTVRSRYYDIHWPLATVLQTGTFVSTRNRNGHTVKTPQGFRVGLSDGRELVLNGSPNVLATLNPWDLIHVDVDDIKKTATLKIPPHVQGAVVVLEAKTGRVLALDGGFSFGGSQFNRAGYMGNGRQVGSTIKPFADMAALQAGYQPDTLVPDLPFAIPLEHGKPFTFKNADGLSGGLISMRVSIEDSLNIPTMQIACRVYGDCASGLSHIMKTLGDFVYAKPLPDYSVILGAQESRVLNMAAAYATFANVATVVNPKCPQCLHPVPHTFDRIDKDGKKLWARDETNSLLPVTSVDRTSIYQMRRILEGGPYRGTTKALRKWAGKIACKTGTTNKSRDAWMICITNDLVVATWVGYDDDRSLGATGSGATAALPIGEAVLQKTFELYGDPGPLAPAPPDIAAQIYERPLPDFGVEALRLDSGAPIDTRYALLSDSEKQLPVAGEAQVANNDGPNDVIQAPPTQTAQNYGAPANRYGNGGPDTDFNSWDRTNPRQYDPDFNRY